MTQKVGKATNDVRPRNGKGSQRTIDSRGDGSEQQDAGPSKSTTEVGKLFDIDGLLLIAKLIEGVRKEGRLGN